jgi:glycosyltransferase involved in cell wall biosynthesis
LLKLFFLVRSLERGGAERQLVDLIGALDPARFDTTVATFYGGGALRAELPTHTTVLSLDKRGRWDVLPFTGRLVRAVRSARPDVVIGYLNVANELALLGGRLAGAKVAWSLRSSYVDFRQYDALSKWAFRAGARLSRFPDLILVNSTAGLTHHQAHGYSGRRMAVIPNGIDLARFRPASDERQRVRLEWEIADQVRLVGLVGRLDPIKDHDLFLRSAAIVAARDPTVRFACIGGGSDDYRSTLRSTAARLGLRDRVLWAGARADMRGVYNALDTVVCCSIGEGFPNVVAEAMACGTACTVLDVGDAALIVGPTGEVSRSRNAEDLADATERLLTRAASEATLGARARQRIVECYSLDRLKLNMEAALSNLLEAD